MNSLAYSTNTGTTTHDDLRGTARVERINRPRVAKHEPRTRGERFDPSRVSLTLNATTVAAQFRGTDPA